MADPDPRSPIPHDAPTIEGLLAYIHSLPGKQFFRLPYHTNASIQSLYYTLQRDLAEEKNPKSPEANIYG